MTARPVHDLTTNELHQAALECRPSNGKHHWSRLATIVGRLNDDRVFVELGYANIRAYTSMVMGMTPEEMYGLLRLWKLIQAASTEVPITEWEHVQKTYAVEIRKLVAHGASARDWISRALKAATFTEFYAEVCRYLDKELWVTVSARVPQSLSQVFDACLVVALAEATGEEEPDPNRIHDRGTRFLALEVILRNFSQTYVSGPSP